MVSQQYCKVVIYPGSSRSRSAEASLSVLCKPSLTFTYVHFFCNKRVFLGGWPTKVIPQFNLGVIYILFSNMARRQNPQRQRSYWHCHWHWQDMWWQTTCEPLGRMSRFLTTIVTWPHQKCSVWFQMMKDGFKEVVRMRNIYTRYKSIYQRGKKRLARSSKKASSERHIRKGHLLKRKAREAALPIQTFP